MPAQGALQRMEIPARKPHVWGLCRGVQSAQHPPEPWCVLGLDAGGIAGLKELSQAFVFKTLDRHRRSLCTYATREAMSSGLIRLRIQGSALDPSRRPRQAQPSRFASDCTSKPVRRQRREVHGGGQAAGQLGHQAAGDAGQSQAYVAVAEGVDDLGVAG